MFSKAFASICQLKHYHMITYLHFLKTLYDTVVGYLLTLANTFANMN